MTTDKLKAVLDLHAKWKRGEDGGQRANLSGADLRSANLSGANLRSANLSGADLSGADLRSANLSGANLSCANLSCAYLRSAYLSGADLRSAYLSCANLSGADLSGADLRSANLSCAYLRSADLSGANLSGANLSCANLSCADLSGANLSGANLRSANLSGADLRSITTDKKTQGFDLAVARTRILPDGLLIGWKKCRNNVIVKVLIPMDAKRSHAFGRKCRAEYVQVVEVFGADVGISKHDGKTEYRNGQFVRCDKWDETWQEECSGGIHFFITRAEAEAYDD